jgi:hypothetical protein
MKPCLAVRLGGATATARRETQDNRYFGTSWSKGKGETLRLQPATGTTCLQAELRSARASVSFGKMRT